MDNSIYQRLKERAVRTARSIGPPSFYTKHKKELDISLSSFSTNKILHRCRSYIDETKLHPAHGITHCEKVAIEAGAILLIEKTDGHNGPETEELMACAQIAGLLHDIRRMGEDHTITGSLEAGRILEDFDMEINYKRYITAAIRNHEAFKEILGSEDESARLISDSLYDADKFRWGPDNFTTTLWLIVESSGTPAEILYSNFREKMEGIRKIKGTFRTRTGKRYGPEFIDIGIEIGNTIYSEMGSIMRD